MPKKSQSFIKSKYRESGKEFTVFKPKLRVVETKEEADLTATQYILNLLKKNPQAKLVLATASTWLEVYTPLGEAAKKGVDSSHILTFNLDESFDFRSQLPQSPVKFLIAAINMLNSH